MNDLHYIKYLLILAAAMSAIVISQTVGFLMTAIKKRRQMMKYNSLSVTRIRASVNNTGVDPADPKQLYPRIQRIGDSLSGRLFRLRIYPGDDGR